MFIADCAAFDTLFCFPDLRNHLFLFAIALAGTFQSYWFTFLMLDILTMSKILQTVCRSVTYQWQQLLQVRTSPKHQRWCCCFPSLTNDPSSRS